VLLYHHVGPPRPATLPWLTVSPERFARQLAWLRRRGWRTLRMEEVVAWVTGAATLPARAVLITFDDGYADLAQTAFPALAAAGQSATVFLVTGLLGEHAAWDDERGAGGHRLLDEAAVRDWSRRGIEFGAHTRTHRRLDELDDDELDAEIAGSAGDVEALTDRPAQAFAYPYGIHDERVRRAVAASFAVAFDGRPGRNVAGCDPLVLRRTMVQRTDTRADLALRVAIGRSPIELARMRLGRLRRRLAQR
jgi:peptidoglycan/xylan/chitin deacetylase (PgdA/CDA1 family)